MVYERCLISIIIPVFNVKSYLDRCLESVVNQSYPQVEIIVVNDGSDDGSRELCDKWGQRDSRVRVFHKKNGGLSSARNMGLRKARGEFIGFVDSDDYIAQDMYECMYQAMQGGKYNIACCGRIDMYEGDEQKAHPNFVKRKVTYYNRQQALQALFLYDGMDFSSCNKLFHREVLENVQFPHGRSSEDIPAVYKAYKQSKGIIHIGKAKYFYCHRKGSITGRGFYPRRMDYYFFIRDIYKEVLLDYPVLKHEAEFMLYQAAISMWNSIRTENSVTGQYILLEKKMKRIIVYCLWHYISNPYISRNEYKRTIEKLIKYKAGDYNA